MKNVLLLNDISGLGNCSMTANIAVISKLGHNVVPIPTACYSCQTGFDSYHCLNNGNILQFCSDALTNASFDCLYVGFCNDTNTLSQATQVAQQFCKDGKFVIVDPILGDNGKLYKVFDEQYVEAMHNLVQYANVITPNLTEACLLTGTNYDEIMAHSSQATFLASVGKQLSNICNQLGCGKAVITGVKCGNFVGNVVLEDGISYVTNDFVDGNYSGTGDLFSSVICGEMANGHNLLQATQVSANFVAKCVLNTSTTNGKLGVEFCKVLDLLKKE